MLRDTAISARLCPFASRIRASSFFARETFSHISPLYSSILMHRHGNRMECSQIYLSVIYLYCRKNRLTLENSKYGQKVNRIRRLLMRECGYFVVYIKMIQEKNI